MPRRVRGLFENVLSLNKIKDIETLKEKLGELDLPRIAMMNKAGPASVEGIKGFAVLKRAAQADHLFPLPQNRSLVSLVHVRDHHLFRRLFPLRGTHQLSSCPTAGPVQCGRFDCQADHLPQRCPVIIHAANTSCKRPGVDFDAVRMLDNVECNALETQLSVNAVPDIPANFVR